MRVNPDPNVTLQILEQDAYTDNCIPNEDVMKYKPVRMKFFHYDKSTSKRKLLCHDGDAKTGVRLHFRVFSRIGFLSPPQFNFSPTS